MGTEIVFISVYRCPSCGTALEAVNTPPSGWLRCPRCGRPSLPPPYTLTRTLSRPTGANGHAAAGEDVLWIPAHDDRRRPMPGWLKGLAFVGALVLTALVSLALGQELGEVLALVFLLAVGLVGLIRPWGKR